MIWRKEFSKVHSGKLTVKVVVLGGGLIGVASAWYLAKAGLDVCVIERNDDVALETSFANGGQISTSHTDPWASPENIAVFLKNVMRKDAPVRLSLRADGDLMRWGMKFVANAFSGKAGVCTERMLKLALWSRVCLQEIQSEHNFDYHRVTKGILHIYRNPDHFKRSLKQARLVTALGCNRLPVGRSEMLDIEPSLTQCADQLCGAVYCPEDESGDAHLFTRQLAEQCQQLGVRFMFSSPVSRLIRQQDRISAVQLQNGNDIPADTVVVAMGSYSAKLLKPFTGHIPVYPVKGYSVTLPIVESDKAPEISLIDDEKKLVYSRFAERMRIAGLAEFSGFDLTLDSLRGKIPLENATRLFDGAFDTRSPEFWTGLRPQTPDNVPVIGKAGCDNMFVNTGHGTLGWTMAAGSGQVMADLVTGKTPAIDMSGFGFERF